MCSGIGSFHYSPRLKDVDRFRRARLRTSPRALTSAPRRASAVGTGTVAISTVRETPVPTVLKFVPSQIVRRMPPLSKTKSVGNSGANDPAALAVVPGAITSTKPLNPQVKRAIEADAISLLHLKFLLSKLRVS